MTHCVDVIERLSTRSIEFPEYARLADREQKLLAIVIDEYAFEHIVHVQRVTRRMLEPPFHLAGGGVDGQCRVREQRIVLRRHAAAGGRPRLGLCRSDVKRIQPIGRAAGRERVCRYGQNWEVGEVSKK